MIGIGTGFQTILATVLVLELMATVPVSHLQYGMACRPLAPLLTAASHSDCHRVSLQQQYGHLAVIASHSLPCAAAVKRPLDTGIMGKRPDQVTVPHKSCPSLTSVCNPSPEEVELQLERSCCSRHHTELNPPGLPAPCLHPACPQCWVPPPTVPHYSASVTPRKSPQLQPELGSCHCAVPETQRQRKGRCRKFSQIHRDLCGEQLHPGVVHCVFSVPGTACEGLHTLPRQSACLTLCSEVRSRAALKLLCL